VKFHIYKNGSPAKEFELCGAYLFGVDGVPFRLPGKITFKNGLIEHKKRNLEAAGLALLWPIDGFGQVLLATTRLQERTRPYNLSVELARGKLMEITTKREDWAVFDQADSLDNIGSDAQDLFIQSLQHISEPSKASVLADKALTKALFFAEKLAGKHAELLFDAKCKSGGFGKHCLGCRIDPAQLANKKYLEKLLELFGFVTVPVSWAQIEPRKGSYDFSRLDVCIETLRKKKLAIAAGPLLRFDSGNLPRWLLAGDKDFEQIREVAYEFVSNTVSRYSRYVHAWHVISGLNAFNHFKFSFGQILEMTRAATLAARAVNVKSLKLIEITHPWGEYCASTPDTIPPLVYVDMIMQSGISFDAFGLKLVFGKNTAGMHLRDMMQISALLDRFSGLNKPLHITAAAVPGRVSEDSVGGGLWHEEWSQTIQAGWVEQFYKIALSKPFVETVSYAMLSDNDAGDLIGAGLLTDKLEPKKAFRTIKQLRKAILNQ